MKNKIFLSINWFLKESRDVYDYVSDITIKNKFYLKSLLFFRCFAL